MNTKPTHASKPKIIYELDGTMLHSYISKTVPYLLHPFVFWCPNVIWSYIMNSSRSENATPPSLSPRVARALACHRPGQRSWRWRGCPCNSHNKSTEISRQSLKKNTFTVHVHGDCMAPKVIRKLKKHVALEPSPPTPSFETWYKKATLPLFILSKFPLVVTLLPRVAAHHWWCSLGAKCWLVNTQSNGSFTFSVHAGWSGGDIMSWRFLPKS